MLKKYCSQKSFINPKFFYEDPTDVMDEDIAKLSTLSPLINTNGPLLYRQKSILENKCTKHYHGQWHCAHDFKNNSYAKHIQ
jgi:hypothetical protein